MKTLKFKTNIKCSGCVAAVTPELDKLTQIEKWEVDTVDPAKILTVTGENVSDEEVKAAVKRAGYEIEQL